MKRTRFVVATIMLMASSVSLAYGQDNQAPADARQQAALPALPRPLGVPKPAEATDKPYAPQPILQGGIVVTLFSPDSHYLKADRVHEAEQYSLSRDVPGRINSIVNIHNPSIEVHTVDNSLNTGAAIILAAGGGHNTLNVGAKRPILSRTFTTTV